MMKGGAISTSINSSLSETSILIGQDVVTLLHEAAVDGAQVSVFDPTQQNWPWLSGKIKCSDSQTIEVAVGDNCRNNIGQQENKKLLAKLYYNENVYQFETTLAMVRTASGVISLSCPEVIAVCERRRFPRRALRRQSIVQIILSSDNSPCAIGEMLNVSSAGLACRLSNDDASTLLQNAPVRAIFKLEDTNTEYNLAGRVTNKSEAGTTGHCIVGIEFDDPADQAIRDKITLEIDASRTA